MRTVTFARKYRHELDDLRGAVYPANLEIEVSTRCPAPPRKRAR